MLETGLGVGQLSESGAAHVNRPEWAKGEAGVQGYAFRWESRENVDRQLKRQENEKRKPEPS